MTSSTNNNNTLAHQDAQNIATTIGITQSRSKHHLSKPASSIYCFAANYDECRRADRIKWHYSHINNFVEEVETISATSAAIQIVKICTDAKSNKRRYLNATHVLKQAMGMTKKPSMSSLDLHYDYSLATTMIRSESMDSIKSMNSTGAILTSSQSMESLQDVHNDDASLHKILTTLTQVHTAYAQYGVTFALDMSPSMISVDPFTGDVMFDRVFGILEKSLAYLLAPLKYPNSDVLVIIIKRIIICRDIFRFEYQ